MCLSVKLKMCGECAKEFLAITNNKQKFTAPFAADQSWTGGEREREGEEEEEGEREGGACRASNPVQQPQKEENNRAGPTICTNITRSGFLHGWLAEEDVALCSSNATASRMLPINSRRDERYFGYSSMSLCPAPSTHTGSTAPGHAACSFSPCEKWMTSSCDGSVKSQGQR